MFESFSATFGIDGSCPWLGDWVRSLSRFLKSAVYVDASRSRKGESQNLKAKFNRELWKQVEFGGGIE